MSGAQGAFWEHNYMSHTFLTGDILKMKLDNMAIERVYLLWLHQCSRHKFVQEGHIMRFIPVCNPMYFKWLLKAINMQRLAKGTMCF